MKGETMNDFTLENIESLKIIPLEDRWTLYEIFKSLGEARITTNDYTVANNMIPIIEKPQNISYDTSNKLLEIEWTIPLSEKKSLFKIGLTNFAISGKVSIKESNATPNKSYIDSLSSIPLEKRTTSYEILKGEKVAWITTNDRTVAKNIAPILGEPFNRYYDNGYLIELAWRIPLKGNKKTLSKVGLNGYATSGRMSNNKR